MEKNNAALSDVERNKELFEYEMTEVILQLKCEFAKVSGKDLQLDEVQFEAPAMEIPPDIPTVTVQPIALDAVGASASVSGDAFVIPEITINNTEIDCPAVPTPVVAMPSTVEVTKPELGCMAVAKFKDYSEAEVTLELPTVSTSVPDISIAELSDITVPEIKMQSVNTAIKVPKTDAAAQIRTVQLDIPDTNIDISDAITNVEIPESQRVTVPHVDKLASVNNQQLNVSPIKVEVGAIHSSVQYLPVTIEIKHNYSGDVIVPKIPEYTAQAASLGKVDIHSPKVPKMFAYEDTPIILVERKIDSPAVSTTNMATIPLVSLEQFSEKVETVHIPNMDTLPDEGVSIKVEKPTIKFDYPTAASVQIPTVSVKATVKPSIPDMPDFSSEIQEIIDSAV